MHKLDPGKTARIAVTLLTLAALGGQSARAGQNPYNPNGTAAQLGAGAIATPAYSTGDADGNVSSPYSLSAGGKTITFIATTGGLFESFNNQGEFDFAAGTQLLDTFDPQTLNPTGPLEIDFSSGVGAFGLRAQSARVDSEQFTFSTYNGAALIGTYTTPLYDNTTGTGKAVFLGAQATGGDVFTKVVISSTSITKDPVTGDNDFYFGPLSFQQPAAVPEASSAVGLGLGLALFAGLALTARRRTTRI